MSLKEGRNKGYYASEILEMELLYSKIMGSTTAKQLSKIDQHNHKIVPGEVQAKQILGQVKDTAGTEQNPINHSILAAV